MTFACVSACCCMYAEITETRCFHSVGPRDRPQFVRVGGKHLNLLSRIARPLHGLL